MQRVIRRTAFIVLTINVLSMLVLFPASGEATSSVVYLSVKQIIDDMSKSGAISVDETRKTEVDGWPYAGPPALPIAHAAMKANHLYTIPALLVIINSVAMLAIGLSIRPIRVREQQAP